MKTHACIHEAACSPMSLQNVPLKFDKQNLFFLLEINVYLHVSLPTVMLEELNT